MTNISGTWTDGNGAQIKIFQSDQALVLEYNNGRGRYNGELLADDCTIKWFNTDNGGIVLFGGGWQTGQVLNGAKRINWQNGTHWAKS
jgi:hypothetical protein